MLDKKATQDNFDFTMYGEDTLLYTQNLVTVSDYRGLIEGEDNAEVLITDRTTQETVEFLPVGHGLYRDIDNGLTVDALHTYELNVSMDGRDYSARTTVPGNFQISNIDDNDTIVGVAKFEFYNPSSYAFNFPPSWTSSTGQFFYRTDHSASIFNFTVLNHVYEPPGFFTVARDSTRYPLPLTVSGWYQVTALDTAYGKMYSAESPSTAPIELLTYLSNQETVPLPQRTNIVGKHAVGVFGSVNRTNRVQFYVTVNPPNGN
jgi:hypothetical protein